MTIHSSDFYTDIKTFEDFREVFNSIHYQRVPDDWWVIVTDVAGSTKAISEGRYKEVNLVGAASIIAVVNALKEKSIPYVFGGDGATILVHESDVFKIKPVLIATQQMAKATFDLEIRAGAVPVSRLTAEGKFVEVAKYRLSSTASLAMIRGGGVNLAEKLVKNDASFSFKPDQLSTNNADLNGLSCRWSPIPSKCGQILSILVVVREGTAPADEIYKQVLISIEDILGDHHESHPVTFSGVSNRRMSWKSVFAEVKMQTHGKNWGQKLGSLLWIVTTFAFMNIFIMLKWRSPLADSEKYVKEVAEGSDFRKFDDTLRMIRDCSVAQKQKIETLLEELWKKGQIFYGTYSSSHSLMTCYVASLTDHIHFIDGSDGGYAMASKQMKQQIQSANEKNGSPLK